jgi:RHS repeat-associated protein
VLERYGYNGFGGVRYMNGSFGSIPVSGYDWETLFCSYRHDSESGLYQVRFRYLHPLLGRWTSRDPIQEQGGLNLYAYVGNNTINKIDSLGLDSNIMNLPIPYNTGNVNAITAPIKVDTDKCCENGKMVNKVSVYVVNRGSPVNQQPASTGLPQWTGGHIDLVIPGCGVGMVGFYGNQAGGQGITAATFSGIPGTENIDLNDWLRPPQEGGRINYLAPESGLMINTANGPVNVPGVRSYICEIKVCPSDAKKMCQRAQQIRSNPGSFRMLGRNCSTMGCSILNAGGAGPNGISGIDSPQALQSQIGSKNCFYGYTALDTISQQITVQRATNQSPPAATGGSSP